MSKNNYNTYRYWDEDQYEFMIDNLSSYVNQAEEDKAYCSEPLLKDKLIIYNLLIDYFKNKYIITGDLVINYLLNHKNGQRTDFQLPYLKIYSKNARMDIKNICDYLLSCPEILIDKKLGYKLIQGLDTKTETIYGIKINATYYCDIIQIDSEIFDFIWNNKKTYLVEKDSLYLINDYFINVDFLKILTNSKNLEYWKNIFIDFYQIQTKYDFIQGFYKYNQIENNKKKQKENFVKQLIPYIWKNKQSSKNHCAITGVAAYNFFYKYFIVNTKLSETNKNFDKLKEIVDNSLELVSTKYIKIINKIILFLKSTNYKYSIKEYYGFFRYFGKSIKFNLYEKESTKIFKIIIYQCDGTSIPIFDTIKQVNYVSFTYLLNYFLCNKFKLEFQNKINKDSYLKNDYIIGSLVKMRELYIKNIDGKDIKNSIVKSTESIFKLFTIKTIGKISSENVEMLKRKKYNPKSSFSYEPFKEIMNLQKEEEEKERKKENKFLYTYVKTNGAKIDDDNINERLFIKSIKNDVKKNDLLLNSKISLNMLENQNIEINLGYTMFQY